MYLPKNPVIAGQAGFRPGTECAARRTSQADKRIHEEATNVVPVLLISHLHNASVEALRMWTGVEPIPALALVRPPFPPVDDPQILADDGRSTTAATVSVTTSVAIVIVV